MENTLLVGLSRQMTLERQLDVVANNVANINTTGFKADRSLFEEYLRSPAAPTRLTIMSGTSTKDGGFGGGASACASSP